MSEARAKAEAAYAVDMARFPDFKAVEAAIGKPAAIEFYVFAYSKGAGDAMDEMKPELDAILKQIRSLTAP